MNNLRKQSGLTLIEIIAAVSIIVILISIVINVAIRIENRGKEQLAEGLMAALNTALSQFRDYGYEHRPNATGNELTFYQALKFPPDCNDFTDIVPTLEKLLDPTSAIAVVISGGTYDIEYSGCGVMYFFLNLVPTSRQTIEKIDRKFITNLDANKNPIVITVDAAVNPKRQPFFRIVDPWGTTLKYDYYDETKTNPFVNTAIDTIKSFPLLTSAGPDRLFGTVDDITNR